MTERMLAARVCLKTLPARGAKSYLTALFLGVLLIMSVFLAAVEWVGERTGATMLPKNMAAAQNRNTDLIVLPPEVRHWASLKLARIAYDQPEVVLVGSSRGNEIRSAMFSPYKFYNASLTAWSLDQTLAMVDHVTEVSKPRVILLSLDYFMFTNAYAASVARERTMYFNNDLKIKYQSVVNLLRSLYTYPALWRDRFPAYLLGTPKPKLDGTILLGLDAIRAEAGMRWDGSFLYDAGLLAAAPERTRENKGLIEAMPGGAHIDARQWAILEKLAALAVERHVTLVGIQWPILGASVDYLDNDPAYRPYAGVWRAFQSPEFAGKLRDIGIGFYDLSRLPMTADSRKFIDAAHADESGMLDAFIYLNEDPQFHALFPSINIDALREKRAEAHEKREYFAIYNNQF